MGSVGVTRLGGHFWQKYLEVLPKSSKKPARYFGETPEVEGLPPPMFRIYVQGRSHRSNLLIGFQGIPIRFLKAPLDASRALWGLAHGYK